MKKIPRMARQDQLTSEHYLEMVPTNAPYCIEDGIPMAVLYDHGVKGKNPHFFCGHCGIVVPQNL